ncbi:conserved hypothetical protein [Candida albicans WO-1]|uniref:Uncharacterized protein n=1 Tax=Candida albicans (strain WO-1) TaxID=294748 RepID=C4YID5_CANAW|nr:conserved hypothetical protein [Candida albicans WO-1]
MIRGNWSLADEFKKNEKKQISKIQQRQRDNHKLEKLKAIDPIHLYYKIDRLDQTPNKSEKDNSYLNKLKEDWDFILKYNLHSSKLKPFLENQQKKQQQKLRQQTKLWGQKSIYFNPELNPLGKVPELENLPYKLKDSIENLTVPLKGKQINYSPGPIIKELQIKCPPGQPPRFYKLIQNTSKKNKHNSKSNNTEVLPESETIVNNNSSEENDSPHEEEEEEEEEGGPDFKRYKHS